ncbi:MAG TPA: 30S ribosomal protein S16 [Exilispira sp.]|jgi:small subunit ribosomal protein S16|nr:30S ribosomal protein S16 [Spirochaetota bacterium]HNV43801.1 30S ribosomal protein S16 [Exilispira sp.]HPB47253.1 30S ribosomal protein S16 [Exilispira sp.]HQM88610.1 30S ribosomal protein S16 [Exilispira sp.]HQQ18734.1 30S ribosomal protein S16 [Exilispira sp.]
MVKLRLKKVGRRNQIYFRLVAVDERFPRDGRFIEELGSYNPHETDVEKKFQFKGEPNQEAVEQTKQKIIQWFKNGAQPSPTVYKLLAKKGLVLKEELRKS